MSKATEPQNIVAPSRVLQAKDGIVSLDWYAPGQTRIVDVAGIRLAIRLVDRKGRRARIAVSTHSQIPTK